MCPFIAAVGSLNFVKFEASNKKLWFGCKTGLTILQNKVISQCIEHHNASQPHSGSKHCSYSPRWTAGLSFWQKGTCRWVGWICQLEVILTSDNHYFFSFHIICAFDNKWHSCENYYCLQNTGWMSALNILTPSLIPPWSCSPGALTQVKNMAKVLPQTRLLRGKTAGQNNKQHWSQSTKHGHHQTQVKKVVPLE